MSDNQKYIVPPIIGSTTMENEIILLQTEIATIGAEIQALKEQAIKLKQDIPTPQYAGDPKQFGREVKAASQTLATHQPQVELLEQAIASLQSSLPEKNATLAELKKEQIRQQRLTRLDEGRQILRAKISEVTEVAADLGKLYLEFKSLHSRFSSDYNTENYKSGSYILYDSLIRFGNLYLPQLIEEQGQFILTSVPFDAFRAEKAAAQQAETTKWADIHKSTEAAAQLQRLKREQFALKTKRENLGNLIKMKQQDLDSTKAKKAEWQGFGGAQNFERIDSYIFSIETEINSIQTELDALPEV